MTTRILALIRPRGAVRAVALLAALAFGVANVHANNLTWNTTSGIWDIGITPNWTGDATVFANGDDVTFDNTSGGTVTIAAGGVLPNSTAVSAASGTYTLSGGSLGGSGTLTKSGGGGLILSGANSFTGKTTVLNGPVDFNSIGNVGAGSSALGAPATVSDGTIDLGGTGTLNYTGSAKTSDRVINLTSGSGNLTIRNLGSGLLTLTGGITGENRSLVFRGDTAAQGITASGLIESGSLICTVAGTLTLSNPSNTFSGDLGIYGGTVSVDSIADGGTPSPLGMGTVINFGQVSFGGFGKLQFTGTNGGSCNRSLSIRSLSGIPSGAIIENTVANKALVLSGYVSSAGTGTPQLQLIGAGDGELTGTIGGSGVVMTMDGTGAWVRSGAFSSSSGTTIVNSGTLVLSNGNYSAGETIVNGGVLKLAHADALNSSAITTVNGGLVDLSAISPTLAGFAGNGGLITNNSETPVTLTLADSTFPLPTHAYSGGIKDGGAGNAISIYNSSGIQQLTGANSYSGTTTVAAGTLALGTVGAAINSPIAVNDGATLGVVVTSAGTSFSPANLTLGNGGGAAINCFLGNFGNPTAPVLAPGSLTVNGTLTVNVSPSSTGLTLGSFTILKHASAPNIATALGSLPGGISAHLTTNVANSSIDLVVDCVGLVRWSGSINSDWDISGTANWSDGCSAGAITYNELSVPGPAVTFNDSATQNLVNLTATVSPQTVTVSNSVLAYTFDGFGLIAGPGALTKSGSAKLTVVTDNSYTGGTVINDGTVSLGNGGSTGKLGTGAITNNAALEINRSDSPTISQVIRGTGSVELNSTLNLTGANTYSGGTMFNAGTLGIGVASVNTGATVVSGATGVGNMTLADGVALADSANQWAVPTVFLQGDITLNGNTRQRVVIGTLDLGGGTRTIHLNGTGGNIVQTIPTPLGGGVNEGTGRNRWETQTLGTPMVVTNGNLIVESTLTGSRYEGFMFQNASVFANNGELTIGPNVYLQTLEAGSLGSTTNNAAKLTVNGIWTLLGTQGTTSRRNQTIYSLAGSGRVFASMAATGASNPRRLWIIGTAGTTDFSGLLSDGTDSGKLALVKTGGSTQILSGEVTYSGSTTISGGTLALTGDSSLANSSSFDIGPGATLNLSGSTSHTLTLTSGKTLSGGGSINGTLVAQDGSTVSPGSPVGTLTVTGDVTLNGGLRLELNRTNMPNCDHIVSDSGTVTYGGTLSVTNIGPGLQPGDTFQLFPGAVTGFSSIELATSDAGGSVYTWNNKVAVDGSIEVVTALNTNPAPIQVEISGNQLVLSWPADHTTWRLQAQTNGLDVGLSGNWVTIPDTELSNSYTNTIDPAQGSVFYRMVYP